MWIYSSISKSNAKFFENVLVILNSEITEGILFSLWLHEFDTYTLDSHWTFAFE